MSFFQNPFPQQFRGNLVLGDRQHIPEWISPQNAGRDDDLIMAWNNGPYDLSGQDADGTNDRDILNLRFAIDVGTFLNWTPVAVDIGAGAVSLAATTVDEIALNLNEDGTFSSFFTATVDRKETSTRLLVRSAFQGHRMKFYVVNGSAEEALGFNARAGISELPSYFDRHTVDNRLAFADANNHLIALDPAANIVDADLIDNAIDGRRKALSLDSSTILTDWQLLEGRSGLFQFTNNTLNGASQVTQSIVYSAGALVGDLSLLTSFVYDSTDDTEFIEKTEVPHVLVLADLITPP